MARDNYVRLSDEELQLLDEAGKKVLGEDTAEEVSRGLTVGKIASEVLEDES